MWVNRQDRLLPPGPRLFGKRGKDDVLVGFVVGVGPQCLPDQLHLGRAGGDVIDVEDCLLPREL